jgi:hypothetical protein
VSSVAPGARVVIRGEEWLVRRINPDATLVAIGLSELVRDQEAVFVPDLEDVVVLAPEDTVLVRDETPGHRSSRLYLEALLRQSPPTDDTLTVGHRAAIDPAPYQYVPAAQALGQFRPRILMADGVGLGKTIQVGILLSELVRRGKGQRILVVALKSILPQFQAELWARFTLPLVRLDSVGIQRVQARIPSNANPFHHFDKVIVSIDTLKKDARYRRHLEDCHWDAVVIDECQNVAVRGTQRSQRARLAQMLARNTDALLLTSATPHDGSRESFASLMRLLDPTAIADTTRYTRDDVGHLFVRRFQCDIRDQAAGRFFERDLSLVQVPATDAEEQVFAAIKEVRFQTIGRGKADGLFRELVLKSWLSSPAACAQTLRHRHAKVEAMEPSEARTHDLAALDDLSATLAPTLAASPSKLERLFALLDELGFGEGRNARKAEKVVLFTERIETMHWLAAQLADRYGLALTGPFKGDPKSWDRGPIALFHGGLPDQEQYALIRDFNNATGTVKLLIGTDAASEGLNLHHDCHQMVHYDVPWSLITLEQRNGRIDRFGQTTRPVIRYLLTEPNSEALRGDLHIIRRLIDKEQEAATALGDVAWLLNKHDAAAEETRIAEALRDGEAPEDVLPEIDAVEGDWLDSLFEEENAFEEDGAQGEMFAADAPATGPTTTTPPSLFPSDLAYAQEGFAHLDLLGTDRGVTWFDELQGFRIVPPPDLAHRYRSLPPELRPSKSHELQLTADRERVKQAYAHARDTEDGWPDWELWWEQHPIARWLNDRVLASYRRHEAPVIEVARGLPEGGFAYLFQSTQFNERSQPVNVDWSLVRREGATLVRVDARDHFADLGLDGPIANTGRPVPVDRVQRDLGNAIHTVKVHLAAAKTAYELRAAKDQRPVLRRLRRWHQAERDRLREGLDPEATDARTRRRLQRLMEVKTIYDNRRAWLDQTLRIGPTPYIRLAAVLVRPR